MTRTKLLALRRMIEHLAENLSDETALDYTELYPQWLTDHAYSIGDRVRYSETLYKYVQAHTSQIGYEPDVAVSLWAEQTNLSNIF